MDCITRRNLLQMKTQQTQFKERQIMTEELVLTKEIAERFVKTPDSVDLSDFTSIEDSAAEIISNYEGQLSLYGLSKLSSKSAKFLSRHKGRLLICQINHLSLSAAKFIIQHENLCFMNSEYVTIRGLRRILPLCFPDETEIPIYAKLYGWLGDPYEPYMQKLNYHLNPEDALKLARAFPTDITMYLSGWFGKIEYDALEQLVTYPGSICIAANQLAEDAYRLLSKLNASEIIIDTLVTAVPVDFSIDFATALLSFRNKIKINPDFVPDDRISILEQHASLSFKGSLSYSS